MGQPAARLGDPHSKGPILEGSKDVRIGGQPAGRLGDKVQHKNGVEAIVEGESTVRINSRLAAREGDRVGCQDVILKGCPTVRIGLPAQGKCLMDASKSGATFVQATE